MDLAETLHQGGIQVTDGSARSIQSDCAEITCTPMTAGIPGSGRTLGEISLETQRSRVEPLDFSNAVCDLQRSDRNARAGALARYDQDSLGSVKVQQFADDLGKSSAKSSVQSHKAKQPCGDVFL